MTGRLQNLLEQDTVAQIQVQDGSQDGGHAMSTDITNCWALNPATRGNPLFRRKY